MKKWDGPYVFIDRVGETLCVQLPHGRKIFHSTAVQPAPADTLSSNMFNAIHTKEEHDFREARLKEIEGLNARGVFETVPRSSVPKNKRIYKLGWVDKAKILDDGTTTMSPA